MEISLAYLLRLPRRRAPGEHDAWPKQATIQKLDYDSLTGWRSTIFGKKLAVDHSTFNLFQLFLEALNFCGWELDRCVSISN